MNAIDLLKQKNIKITDNRIKIISCLQDETHFHSISEIVKHLNGKINTKSVYNNIKFLINKNMIDSFSFGGIVKYAISDNIEKNTEIHVINNKEINHMSISNEIILNIKKEVEKKGFIVENIKIFVKIK